MPTYSYCGVSLQSSVLIPELIEIAHDTDLLRFTLRSSLSRVQNVEWVSHLYSSSGELSLSYGRQAAWHWLKFPRLAYFRISRNISEVDCFPFVEVEHNTIIHLLLDQVLPRCLAHQGKIMLHASAVTIDQGLILFIGNSGVGKSTMAGNFHQAGYLVASDDCIHIEKVKKIVMAFPTYGGLRLWNDSLDVLFPEEVTAHSMAHYSSKKRVKVQPGDSLAAIDGYPVRAMVVLSQTNLGLESTIALERLSPREAYIATLKQTFQLDWTNPERAKSHMRVLGDIILNIPIYKLSMPHDYGLLPLVRQKIIEVVM